MMLNEARDYVLSHPFLAVPPGIALLLTVLGFIFGRRAERLAHKQELAGMNGMLLGYYETTEDSCKRELPLLADRNGGSHRGQRRAIARVN
jgi:hypothetical protein